ncbi:hypothetical protein [Actinoplanes sp. GCM10030250]|uniref:hypothetical protein n=1 Tax=Actinoplanes sp. GCM10030250 TaxID=3273376 RepID=UPI00361A0284
MTTIRLLAHRHRLMIAAWLVLLLGLIGGTVWAYRDTYATAQQQATAVRLARADTATTLLYGELPLPGTPAQMFTWEVGGIVTILAAVFAVLLTVALTRATEDDGTLELIRSCGVSRHHPLEAAAAVLTAVAALLAGAGTVALGMWAGHVDGVTLSGAVAFNVTIALSFLLVAAVTAVLSQAASSAPAARLYGLTAFAFAFAVRAVADVQNLPAGNWLSPLGLRATVRPFTAERWWTLPLFAIVVASLWYLARSLSDRREYRSGLITLSGNRDHRLTAHSVVGLRLRLTRRSTRIWAAAATAIGLMFTAMGSGVVEQSRDGDMGGFLGSQMGTADPVAAYCAYTATLLGILVSAYAVLQVLDYRHQESAGRIGLQLATGVHRSGPLLAHAVAAVVGTAAMLAAAATATALLAPVTIGGSHAAMRMFTFVTGQWPATAVLAGAAALLAGWFPRLIGLVWLPFTAGGVLALLGPLLDVPRNIRDLGPFQQVPDFFSDRPDWFGLLMLLILAVAATSVGLAGANRRDVLAG